MCFEELAAVKKEAIYPPDVNLSKMRSENNAHGYFKVLITVNYSYLRWRLQETRSWSGQSRFDAV